MIPIKYVEGDATLPQGEGRKIIAHVCNNMGTWGAAFVVALSERCSYPEDRYLEWWRNSGVLPYELDDAPPCWLGEIQFSDFNREDAFVCNMVAQDNSDERLRTHSIPLDYAALRHCLRKLANKAHAAQASIHMPRIGCGIAGGDWTEVSRIIMQEVSALNVPVTVYDLPQDTIIDTCFPTPPIFSVDSGEQKLNETYD